VQKATGPRPLDRALGLAGSMLDANPEAALEQAEAILKQAPGLPPAELIACQALRRLGRLEAALARASALARDQPHALSVIWELAQIASEAGYGARAIAALEAVTAQQPAAASAWFMLARELRRTPGAPISPESTPRPATRSC
jgi:predicted Zn-dependent protease